MRTKHPGGSISRVRGSAGCVIFCEIRFSMHVCLELDAEGSELSLKVYRKVKLYHSPKLSKALTYFIKRKAYILSTSPPGEDF